MNFNESKFTIVIPLIPQHDFEIKRILTFLVNEQYLIKEVIICRSETRDAGKRSKRKFAKYAKDVGFIKDIKVDAVKSIARDGENRNRGWSKASSEFVAFLDADDWYLGNRLSVILDSFRTYKVDAIVHNYNSSGETPSDYENALVDRSQSLKVILGKKENVNNYLSDVNGNELKVHFAHITVRNEVKENLMFTGRFPGADWEFAISLADLGYEMRYLDAELSGWNRKRSTRYLFRIYKMRMKARLNQLMNVKFN